MAELKDRGAGDVSARSPRNQGELGARKPPAVMRRDPALPEEPEFFTSPVPCPNSR